MIRVLQVIHSMNLGGAENFIMNVYRNIDRTEIQFDFLVNAEGVFDPEIRQMGGKIWEIPYVNKVGPIRYRRELKCFFQTHTEYQVIHSHLDMVSGEVVECAKKAGVKCCITHSHNTDTTGNWCVKRLKEYYQTKVLRYADVYMACSEQAGQWLYKNDEAIVIKNAIDVDKFCFREDIREDLRCKYHISDETTVLGHVGRFSKVKNHEFLLNLFELYCREHGAAILLLCGTGDLKINIQKQVAAKHLQDRVIFFDASTDVYKMYNMMDVFVFPSLYEGMSLAMLEAQANGLPIVASDTVDDKIALTDQVTFLNLDDVSEWIVAIEGAVRSESQDAGQALRNAGYDIGQVASMLENYYEQGAEI